MKKESKNKLLKSALGTTAVVLPVSVGLGFLVGFSRDDQHIKNQNTVERIFAESEVIFKVNEYNLLLDEQTKREIQDKFDEAKEFWSRNNFKNESENNDVEVLNDEEPVVEVPTLVSKLAKINEAQDFYLATLIDNLDKVSLKNEEQKKAFYSNIINNQIDRVREIDLRNQLRNDKGIWADDFLANVAAKSQEEIKEFLVNLREKVTEYVAKQNAKIQNYINEQNDAVAFYQANKDQYTKLSAPILENLENLVDKVIDANIRWNEVQISAELTQKAYVKSSDTLKKSQSNLDELSKLNTSLNELLNSSVLDQAKKDEIQSVLSAQEKQLQEAESSADFERVLNSAQAVYESATNSQKSESELREILVDLETKTNDFSPVLDTLKAELLNKITQAKESSNKAELVSKKSQVSKDYYDLKSVNNLLEEYNQKAQSALSAGVYAQSEIDEVRSAISAISSNPDNNYSTKLENVSALLETKIADLENKMDLMSEAQIINGQIAFVERSPFYSSDVKALVAKLKADIASFASDVANPALAQGLDLIKKGLNEQMRTIAKRHLDNLLDALRTWSSKLSLQSKAANEKVISLNQEINKDLRVLTEPDNPVPTVELLKALERVGQAIANSEASFEQTKTAAKSVYTNDFLEAAFSDGSRDYEFSQNEQNRIDAYKDLNAKLADLRQRIDSGEANPELTEQLLDVASKLNNMTQTAQDFKELSEADKKAQDSLEDAKADKNASELQPLIDDLEAKKAKVAELFNNPNATSAEVAKAKRDLQEAQQALDDEKNRLRLKDLLKELTDKKNATFANLSSPAAQGLQKQIDALEQQIAAGNLSTQEVDQIKERIQSLSDLVEPLNNLENANSAAEQAKNQLANGPFAAGNTQTAVEEENALNAKANEYLAALNNGELPNVAEVQSTASALENAEEKIKVGYQKDKINSLIDQIEATKTDSNNTPATRNNNDINDLTSNARGEVLGSDLERLSQLADQLEKENELAQKLADLQAQYDEVTQEPGYELVGDYIDTLMSNNNISKTDAPEEVQAKIDAINKALPAIEAKKKFAQSIKNLDDILGEEDNWKNHADTKKEIDALKEQMINVLYDDSLTPEEILAKKAELDNKIIELRAQKDQENRDFENAVSKIDGITSDLDDQNATIQAKYAADDADRPNFYETLKAQYENDKQEGQRPEVGTQDILDYETKLKAALNKDKVLDKLNQIKALINSPEFGDSADHNSIKSAAQNYIADILSQLQNPELTPEQVEALYKTAVEQASMIALQKQVADEIVYLSQDEALNKKSIDELKEALNTYKPVADNNYANIADEGEVKGHESNLRDKFIEVSEIARIKERIKQSVENPENGLRKTLSDKLDAAGDSVLPDATQKVNTILDKLLEKTEGSTDKEVLAQIEKQVALVQNNADEFVNLAKKIKTGTDAINNVQNPEAASVKAIKAELELKIRQAQEAYSNPNNIEDIIRMQEEIRLLSEGLAKVDALNTRIKEQLAKVRAIDFFRLNDKPGVIKKREMEAYLRSFDLASAFSITSQEDLDRLTKIDSDFAEAVAIVEVQEQIHATVSQLRRQTYIGNDTDIDRMIANMWDTVLPPLAAAQSNSGLRASTSQGSSPVADRARLEQAEYERINDYRNATNDLIEAAENTTFESTQLAAKVAVSSRLKQLAELNNKAIELSQDEQSGELKDIRDNVQSYLAVIDKIKELAKVNKEYESLNVRVIAPQGEDGQKIREEKDGVQALIDSANALISQESPSETELSSKIEEINQAKFRLDLLYKYSQFKAVYDADTLLSGPKVAPAQAQSAELINSNSKYTNETGQIEGLIYEFWSEFDAKTLSAQELYEKYFRDEEEVAQESVKNKLILYVLKNSKELKQQIAIANSYIALEDENIDNAVVKTKFTQLKAKLEEANAKLLQNPNDEVAKKQVKAELEALNNELITEKRNQLDQQLAFDKELKTFVDEQSRTAQLRALTTNSIYLDDYEQVAITDLEAKVAQKDTLSFGAVNRELRNVKEKALEQVIRLYTLVLNKIEETEEQVMQLLIEFAVDNLEARYGANVTLEKRAELVGLDNEIKAVKQANYTNVDDYQTKLDKLLEIANSGAEGKMAAFTSGIKDQFKAKMNPAAQADAPLGLYQVLMNTFNPLADNNLTGKEETAFSYNGLDSLKEEYISLKNQIETLATSYQAAIDTTSASVMAQFATKLQNLNDLFATFVTKMKNEVTKIQQNNPLVAVFGDLYDGIAYADTSEYTNEVKRLYDEQDQAFVAALNLVPADLETQKTTNFTQYKVADIATSSTIVTDLAALLTKSTEHKDWIFQDEVINQLFKQLDEATNINNTLPANKTDAIAPFDAKYKVVLANEDITREAFKRNFESIFPGATDTVDITESDAFLAMFKQFAFTKKDITDSSQKASIFSQSNFRVKIKKNDTNSWFNEIAQTVDDVDRKTLRMKLEFTFRSSNSVLTEYKIEKEVEVSFKTIDRMELKPGLSTIFYTNDSTVGRSAKVKLFNIEEAGWIADGKTADQIETKAYNTYVKMVFGDNYPTTPDSNVDIVTDPGRRVSVGFKTSDPKNPNYNFKIKSGDSLGITYNVSALLDNDNQLIRLSNYTDQREIAIFTFTPGLLVGAPINGNERVEFTPAIYDSRFLREFGSYNAEQPGLTKYEDRSAFVSLNAYKFSFDYDPNTKDLYIFSTWVENSTVVRNKPGLENGTKIEEAKRNLNNAGITKYNEAFDSILALGNKWTLSSKQLNDYIWALSALQGKVIGYNSQYKTELAIGSSSFDNTAKPVWPVSGGQSTIVTPNRTNAQTVKDVILNPVRTREYMNGEFDRLTKKSARNVLYSTSIESFYIKLRRD
ncbi:hypothetical protein [Mycoplasma sp. Ms02]|uniref:hypothetical protein n=1 Tax=Mycoplasma sp. Ms02 TaxID=353851 RepID=UPI001C8AEE6C|nr:hypothetical protein [Mycoplasma sp. Ms02]QZE12346.1 hypothetical protein K4L35_03370 [Mycoplasma sp. Ms02]